MYTDDSDSCFRATASSLWTHFLSALHVHFFFSVFVVVVVVVVSITNGFICHLFSHQHTRSRREWHLWTSEYSFTSESLKAKYVCVCVYVNTHFTLIEIPFIKPLLMHCSCFLQYSHFGVNVIWPRRLLYFACVNVYTISERNVNMNAPTPSICCNCLGLQV